MIGIVCVHYSVKKVLPTLRSLERIRFNVPGSQCVFVANHENVWHELDQRKSSLGESSALIRHNNTGMEFGGYQAGLDLLLGQGDPDWVLFANDTFSTHHSFGAVHRNKLVADLASTIQYPAFIGQIVSWPRSFQIEGARTHRWMSTNLFAVNRAALHALNSRVYWPDLDTLVNETSDMASFFSSRVDPVLREHLEAWLFRAHAGWHWYASDPLTSANAQRMTRKAESILQEKYLAAVLEEEGAAFINLNELSTYRKLIREFERKLFTIKSRAGI